MTAGRDLAGELLFDRLAKQFEALRPTIVKPARGYIPYDYVVPGGFYEQLWDWDGFFISLHFAGRTPAPMGGGAQPISPWAMSAR